MSDRKLSAQGQGTLGQPVVLDTRVVSGSGGGPDKTILNSPRFFAAEGYRMLCAYMHHPEDPGFEHLRRKANAWQAPLHSIADRGPLDWRAATQLLRLCRRERVAIWHGHDYKSNAIGLLLRPFYAMRLVTTVHGWVKHMRRTPIYYGIDRLCLPLYERVICVSEDLKERCLACGVPEERCVLIENGIDTQDFFRPQGTGEAKRRLGIPPERLVVGAVGRLSAEKGFDVLIQSVDRLLAAGLDLELLIAGEGDQAGHLRDLITMLGRGDRIRLLGYCSDPVGLYQAMDVFALSSLREGLPNVLLESMAMGVPVVATRIAGVPRLVRDRENGLLVEAGSADALTSALALLLSDPGLRARLGQEGRRTVEAGYSFRTRIKRIRAIYDELLHPGPPAMC
jgi:glycosyltransferase involved in cell wall biosynthesis